MLEDAVGTFLYFRLKVKLSADQFHPEAVNTRIHRISVDYMSVCFCVGELCENDADD